VQTNGNQYAQLSFIRRPAEDGVTYHVQVSADLNNWSDIATYAGPSIFLSPNAAEVSRIGSPAETVTVRETSPISSSPTHFLRVNVTRP
jgi:hypothetical protein